VKRNGDARPILFVHAAIHGGTHAFRQEVRDIAARHPNVRVHFTYSDPTPLDRQRQRFHAEGFVDAALLGSLLDGPDADFFLCGPKPFMTGVYNALRSLGAKESDIHYEFFGPLQNLAAQPRKRAKDGDEALVGAV
jgi:nitric oxide dioxygenase